MTNDELIARAEAALDGVTKGPWCRDAIFMQDDHACRVAFPEEHGIPGETIAECFQNWTDCENGPHQRISWKSAEANANFITASRDLVPALTAALKASEARVKELEEALVNSRRIMATRQPDKMPDGVHICDKALKGGAE